MTEDAKLAIQAEAPESLLPVLPEEEEQDKLKEVVATAGEITSAPINTVDCPVPPAASGEEDASNAEEDKQSLNQEEKNDETTTTKLKPASRRSEASQPALEESTIFSTQMEDGVAHYLQSRMAGSPFFQTHSASSLPVLDTNEISLGHLLGQGEFGRVHEVIELTDKVNLDGIYRLLRQSRDSRSSHNTRNGISRHSSRTSTITTNAKPNREPNSSGPTAMQGDSEGEDSFCNDEEGIDAFPVDPSRNINGKDADMDEASIEFVEVEQARRARKVLKKRCWRMGKARYAVKQLKEELLVPPEDRDEFHMGTIAAMDLAMEAALLSRLSHPNIVKLRATAGVPGRPDYSLVMDRLYTTLDHQIEEWKLEQPTSNPIRQLFGMGGTWRNASKLTALKQNKRRGKEVDFSRRKYSTFKSNSNATNRLIRQGQLLHRLYDAFDVARALRYLHQHKIVFRDMKPQNIAFNIRGDVRIFDFGLAKELVEAALVQFPDDYNATGMTGSRRWMSPEVYFCESYGLSADVYSFGLLLWNLCTLRTPYGDNLTLKKHHDKVMLKGQRPKKPRSKLIPENLWTLMTMCWSNDRDERPTMDIVIDTLRDAISIVQLEIQESTGAKTAAPSGDGSMADDPAASGGLDATSATELMDPSAVFASKARSHCTVSTTTTSVSSSPNNSFARRGRDGPIFKLFGGPPNSKNSEMEDPVDVSFHHHSNQQNGRIARARWSQQEASVKRRRSRFLPKGFQLRNSDLEGRSDYLTEKSLVSMANLQFSSNHLGSSGGSRPSSRNINSPTAVGTNRSHRRLFGGDSLWSVASADNAAA